MNARLGSRRTVALFSLFIGVAVLCGGCGSGSDGDFTPPGQSGPTIIRMEPSAAKIAELVQENHLDLGDVRFRTDSLAIPFQGSAVFGREGTRFSWSFVDSDPAGVTVFAQDVSTNPENGPVFSWPEHGATVNATYPNMQYQCTVPSPSGAAVDDGVVLTLQNLRSGETFALSGMDPPTGPNVTLINNSIEINSNGVAWGRGFRGSATFDSGWRVEFEKGVFASLGRETCGGAIVFVPPPSRMISIANATFTSAANRTLDFDISTTNSTLNRWTVDLQQNNTTIRSFPPTVDSRGPGTSSGVNPLHVSLPWDGLDASNHTVSGNVTWLINARTTNYVSGGPVNDRIDSAQATVNGSVNEGPAPRLVSFGCEEVTMLDVKNNPIPVPQYDPGRSRRGPIALPMRAARIKAIVRIGIRDDDREDTQFIIQGRKLTSLPGRDPIFGPKVVKFNAPAVREKDFDFPVEVPQRIEKIDDIVWEYQKLKDGKVEWLVFSVSNSPIYVTWDKPRPPQREPRIDVVDYAVEALFATDQRIVDDVVLAKALTTHIYQGGFLYDVGRPHHTVDIGGQQGLIVSNFLTFPGNDNIDNGGNCLDFSNLFQVLGAALGSENFRTSYIDGPFIGRPVKPIGKPLDPAPGQVNYHQVGWCNSSDSVFDPTYRLTLEDGFTEFEALDVKRHKYRELLQDRSKSPHKWEWLAPTRPVRVR